MDYRGQKFSATITYRGSGQWKWARGTLHMWSKNAIKCKLGGHNLKNGAPNLKNGAPYFQKGTPNFTIPHPNENLFEYWFNPQNGVLSPKNLIIAKNFAPAARPFHFFVYIFDYNQGRDFATTKKQLSYGVLVKIIDKTKLFTPSFCNILNNTYQNTLVMCLKGTKMFTLFSCVWERKLKIRKPNVWTFRTTVWTHNSKYGVKVYTLN